MKKVLVCLTFALVLIVSFGAIAQDAEEDTAYFYNGLADIIEKNMDQGGRLIAEVNRYLHKNRDAMEMMNQAISASEAEMVVNVEQEEVISQQGALPQETLGEKGSQAKERFDNAYTSLKEQDEQRAQILGRIMERFLPRI